MDSNNFSDVTCQLSIYVYGRGFVWFQLGTLPLERPEMCVVGTVLGRWCQGHDPCESVSVHIWFFLLGLF